MQDIMSYQSNPNQVHCVSSLNILALQAVYEPILGQGPGQVPMTYVHQSPASYSQTTCANPAEGLWVAASMDVDPMKPVEALADFGLLGSATVVAWQPSELLADSPLAGLR
jgi:hypothetical protein